MAKANYTMQPVVGLPPTRPRGGGQRYYPLFTQLLEAHAAGFFDNPDHYIEVARYGGGGTAGSTRKALLKSVGGAIPAPPAGHRWTLVARRVELDDGAKSVLYARIDVDENAVAGVAAADVAAADVAADGE